MSRIILILRRTDLWKCGVNSQQSQVKEIVGQCVKHLQNFCDRLDKVTAFFTTMQDYIEYIDESRVEQFSDTANAAHKLGHRSRNQVDDAKYERLEKVKKIKLEVSLRFKC